MSSDIGARLLAVRERIALACHRAGRPESAVTLVAVCKGQPAASVLAALLAGQRVFAENYAQELIEKAGATAAKDAEWHFVGGLQKNKVKKLVGKAALIQSLDSAPLAIEIDRRAVVVARLPRQAAGHQSHLHGLQLGLPTDDATSDRRGQRGQSGIRPRPL